MKTEAEIETLLRKAPTPKPAPQLATSLKSAVKLASNATGSALELGIPLWRRWFPALAYTVLILGCVVVLAVQNNRQHVLRRELDQLRVTTADLASDLKVRRESALSAKQHSDEVNKLGKEVADVDRLANEVLSLKNEIGKLEDEKSAKLAALDQAAKMQTPIPPYDFFEQSPQQIQERESKHCSANLMRIGMLARNWAANHNGLTPDLPNLTSQSIRDFEGAGGEVLLCPADTKAKAELERINKELAPQGAGMVIGTAFVSYDVLSPHTSMANSEDVYARCRLHGHVVRMNGAVELSGGAK